MKNDMIKWARINEYTKQKAPHEKRLAEIADEYFQTENAIDNLTDIIIDLTVKIDTYEEKHGIKTATRARAYLDEINAESDRLQDKFNALDLEYSAVESIIDGYNKAIGQIKETL